jgi:formylglycine-generating enzyme required for sulfatase activity
LLIKRARFWLIITIVAAPLSLSLACKKSGESGSGETSQRLELPPLNQFETVKVDSNGSVTDRRIGQVQAYSENAGGVPLEMVEIPAGTFQMGSSESDMQAALSDFKRHSYYPSVADKYLNFPTDETPQHQVRVPRFYMGKYEVTQAQWRAVASWPKVKIDLNPEERLAIYKGDDLPVEYLSWDEAVEFCARLSKGAGREYRLPSEAEWEYAARAGTQTPFAFGETITPDIVNYDGRFPYGDASKGIYRGTLTVLGSLRVANGFGLYDINGNVLEWCQDWYHKKYDGAPTDGSAWLSGGQQKHRVLRGGAWFTPAIDCRSAVRFWFAPDKGYVGSGFRVVAVARQ